MKSHSSPGACPVWIKLLLGDLPLQFATTIQAGSASGKVTRAGERMGRRAFDHFLMFEHVQKLKEYIL